MAFERTTSNQERTHRIAAPRKVRGDQAAWLRVARSPIAFVGLVVCVWFVAAVGSVGPVAQPTSGSSDDTMGSIPSYLIGREIPESVRLLESKGRIAEAETELSRLLSGGGLSETAARAYRIEVERLRRLRRDFPYTAEATLAKIQESIPDATLDDVERWRKSEVLQWLPIDGAVRYFRREPVNLFRFSEEARTRRAAARPKTDDATTTPGDPAARSAKGFTINGHVADILASIDKTGGPEALPVRYRVRRTIRVKPGTVPEGETIRCWMPYPVEYRQQGAVKFLRGEPASPPPVIAPNDAPNRTVYLTAPAAPAGKETVFIMEYEYTCASYKPRIDPEKARAIDPADPALAQYLKEKTPNIPLTPEVRRLAAEIVGDETNPARKAEKIFRWMDKNIRYASEMEYAVMTNVTEKGLSTRKGDCGVHVLVFVALCRASGIPARWQSGWAMRPGSWNLHDWAEYYVAPFGWIPADPSFGLRESDDERVRDYYISGLDSYRMIANQDCDAEFVPKKTHWRSDPVDNQRGEVEWNGGNLFYDDWEYKVEVEYLDTK